MSIEKQHSPEHGPPPTTPRGHEPYQTNVSAVLLLGAALGGAIVITLIIGFWLYRGLLASGQAGDVPPPPVAAERRPPPEPRLQISPRMEATEVRAVEQAVLSNYGWIDAEAGTVRVPIERAMQLLAQEQPAQRQQPQGDQPQSEQPPRQPQQQPQQEQPQPQSQDQPQGTTP